MPKYYGEITKKKGSTTRTRRVKGYTWNRNVNSTKKKHVKIKLRLHHRERARSYKNVPRIIYVYIVYVWEMAKYLHEFALFLFFFF